MCCFPPLANIQQHKHAQNIVSHYFSAHFIQPAYFDLTPGTLEMFLNVIDFEVREHQSNHWSATAVVAVDADAVTVAAADCGGGVHAWKGWIDRQYETHTGSRRMASPQCEFEGACRSHSGWWNVSHTSSSGTSCPSGSVAEEQEKMDEGEEGGWVATSAMRENLSPLLGLPSSPSIHPIPTALQNSHQYHPS